MNLTSVAVGATPASSAVLTRALGLDFAATPWKTRCVDDAGSWQHDAPADRRWWGTYLVQAGSLAEARGLLPLLRSEGKARLFVLVINSHVPRLAGNWSSRSLRTKALLSHCALPGLGFGIVVQGSQWVNVHAAAAAALDAASGGFPQTMLGGLRTGVLEPDMRDWLVGDRLSSLMTPELLRPEPDDIYAVDVIVGSRLALEPAPGRASPSVWSPSLGDLPPVDPAAFSPTGFRPYPTEGQLPLTRADVEARNVPEAFLQSLRCRSYVSVDGLHFNGMERLLARRLTQLAVAGVPMVTSGLCSEVRTAVGEPLLEMIQCFNAEDPPVMRESKSIDMRRVAFEQFGPVGRWNRILEGLGRRTVPDPTVSVLLATRRPDKVKTALAQIAAQTWNQTEVVLVLHGFDADEPSVKSATDAYAGELKVLSVPAETIFGDVLNAGTAAASGDYITKMDDDDWYGRNHIRDLIHAASYSGADLVGSQVEFVYLESLDITTRRPPAGEQYSDHVAGGTMLLRRDYLKELGGWRPVHRAVDRCLLQAVEAAGGVTYRTHGQNYLMHRHSMAGNHGGHTWNPEDSIFLQSVAEQWDGFAPPPQIDPPTRRLRNRDKDLISLFSGVDEI